MSRGGYLGGSTIVSANSLRRDERRREQESNGEPSTVRWGKPKKQAADAEPPVGKQVTQRGRAVAAKAASKKSSNPHPLGTALTSRGIFLKKQVAAGILLPTGKPNPDHPANRKVEPK